MALMLADLGLEHRDAVSAPLEGMSANAAAQYEAQVQAENQARRERILRGAPGVDQQLHSTLSKWNTPQSFGGDDTAEDLQNRYDGQGHRHQLNQRVGQHDNRFGESQQRGRPPPPAQRPALTDMNVNRQRAPSPRSFGTVRIAGGRQSATQNLASTSLQNGIPNIGTGLAAAVQATSTAGNRSARTPTIPSATTSTAPAPRPVSTGPAAPPLPRPASPALSTASSSSTSAVAMAQAAMKARFAAMQKAQSATPASSSPKVEAAMTADASAQVSSEAVEAPITNKSAECASFEASGDLHSAWPAFGPTAGASSNRKSPDVADAQATIKDRIDGQYNGLTPRAVLTTSAQTPTPTRTTTPLLTHRPAVTGAFNGTIIHAPPMKATDTTALVPRGRATLTVSNRTTASGVHANAFASRSSVANGTLSLPTPATGSTSAPVPAAPHSSVGQNGNNSAAVASLPDQEVISTAEFDARRPPQDKDEIGNFYLEHPERRPAFVQARQRLVRNVVQLAAAGDMAAARDYFKPLDPSPDWLIEAAFAAWSGGTPEHDDHPTIKAMITAIEAEKHQMDKPTKVEDQANHTKQTVATPAAQPASSNASDSTNGSATADSDSTAVSTPTPPRTVMGMLTAAFYSTAGSFLGNKEYQLSAPVTVHIAVTTKADEFDPLKLADDMEVLAEKYSNPAATV